MTTLQIRQLPDELHAILSARAEQSRRSLTQQAVVELERSLLGTDPTSSRRKLALAAVRKRMADRALEGRAPDVIAAQIEAWQRETRDRD